MAKMKKEELEKMKRENPADNNWEISDQDSGVRGRENEEVQDSGDRDQGPEAGTLVSENPESAAKADGAAENPDFDVISSGNEVYEKPYVVPAELIEVFSGIPNDGTVDNGRLKTRINKDWLKVDPAIRSGNPVWKFSIKDDSMMRCTTFLFRSGQKVRIFTPVVTVNPVCK